MESTVGVLVMAGLMVLTVIFMIMAMFANLYKKAGPHEALVVYGFRGTRIVKGRGAVSFPWWKVPASLARIDVVRRRAGKGSLHAQGVAVMVEAVAQLKVKSDPESIQPWRSSS